MSKLQFGNIDQIKQAKEEVRKVETEMLISQLHLAFCERDTLSKGENILYDTVSAMDNGCYL